MPNLQAIARLVFCVYFLPERQAVPGARKELWGTFSYSLSNVNGFGITFAIVVAILITKLF